MHTLWLIIQREFVSNVLTSRFMIGFIVCLLSTAVAVFVQVDDYEKRLAGYNTVIREAAAEAREWELYSNLNPILSVDEVSMQKEAQLGQLRDEFGPHGGASPYNGLGETSSKLSKAASVENPEATRLWADYFTREIETKTRFADGQIDSQFRQVQLARDLTQISPIATFQYAMEGLANTGIVSYMDFVKQARRYRQTFIDFIKTEDQGDPESLHIYPVKEGLSQKPVDPDAVPVFEEQISYRSTLTQVGLLVLFNLLFFTMAQVSFLVSEIK